MLPLLESFGFEPPRDVEIHRESLVATLGERQWPIVVLVASWGSPLHLHWREAIAHATSRHARWCVLYNGLACRVMDAARPYSSRYAEFDLDAVADDFRLDEDMIVPPDQAESFVEACRRNHLPYAYVLFQGEQHGFRQDKNIRRAFEGELSFLAQVFGFEPADDIEPVRIENR